MTSQKTAAEETTCLVTTLELQAWLNHETRQDRFLDYVLARRMTRISAAKIIYIHNKLINSQSPHKAIHFRSQLFQPLDIFRFFDFLFGGSLTALVLFSYNRNAAFFTNVSLAESVFAM